MNELHVQHNSLLNQSSHLQQLNLKAGLTLMTMSRQLGEQKKVIHEKERMIQGLSLKKQSTREGRIKVGKTILMLLLLVGLLYFYF